MPRCLGGRTGGRGLGLRASVVGIVGVVDLVGFLTVGGGRDDV